MIDPEKIDEIAAELKALFERHLGRFDPADLAQVAATLAAPGGAPPPKPLGDAHMPDLIGTNLAHALAEYRWRDFCPVSDDGVIISGFEETE